MTLTENTKAYTIIFSIVFFASFYTFKGIFEIIIWNQTMELLISVLVSSSVASLFTPLLISKKRRGIAVVGLSIYFIALFCVLKLKSNNGIESGIEIGDVWQTEESDGENLILDFFSGDSLHLIMPPKEGKVLGYLLNDKKLQIFDEEGNVFLDWGLELENEKLTFFQGNDHLFFYKKQ